MNILLGSWEQEVGDSQPQKTNIMPSSFQREYSAAKNWEGAAVQQNAEVGRIMKKQNKTKKPQKECL